MKFLYSRYSVLIRSRLEPMNTNRWSATQFSSRLENKPTVLPVIRNQSDQPVQMDQSKFGIKAAELGVSSVPKLTMASGG